MEAACLARPVSVVGVVVTVIQCVVVVVTLVQAAPSLPAPHYTSPSVSSVFLGFGTILFSFGGACTFPTIQNDMADRSRFIHSVVIAFVGKVLLNQLLLFIISRSLIFSTSKTFYNLKTCNMN